MKADDWDRTTRAHDGVERAVVTIHKPEAPVEAVVEDISVTIDRAR